MIEFTVKGIPIPQGSMRAIPFDRGIIAGRRTLGVSVVHDRQELASWRKAVSWEGKRAMRGKPPFDCALLVRMIFVLPRPRSRGRTAKADRQPDLDKLVRAILDSLEHVVWVNDSRVCIIHAAKVLGIAPQFSITVSEV